MAALFNVRHELFCQRLVEGHTELKAYELAGYEPETSNAQRLRSRPHIQRRVEELLNRSAAKAEVTRARILSALGAIAFFNPADCVSIDETGQIELDLTGLDRDMAAAIDVVCETTDDGKSKTKIKLADAATRKTCLELLGKHLGLWVERTEHGRPGDFTGVESTTELVEALRKELGEQEANDFATMLAGKGPRTTLN